MTQRELEKQIQKEVDAMNAKTVMSGVAVLVALSVQAAWACGCGCAPKKAEAKKAEAKKAACATVCVKKASSCKACPSKAVKTIDTKALKDVLAKKGVVLLDARSGKWDDGRRIPGAKQLAASADDKTIAAVVGADKNAKIITYCSNTKCPASGKLAARLRKAGYSNVTEYPVGIAGWVESGNKVVKK